MKALSHRRHRDGLALGNQQRGFPPTVDEIHPAYNEEEADKTDEYGACGKGISQGKNHAVRSGLAYAGIRHSSIFLYEKNSYLVLYQPVTLLSRSGARRRHALQYGELPGCLRSLLR